MFSLRSALVASSCLVACSSFSTADAPAVPDVPADQADAGADATDPVVGAPAGCDPTAEPQRSPNCIVDPYGIFVDPTNGDDAKPGTKAAPAKTIAAALGKLRGRRRIYVCDGTLNERVKLRTAVSLFGGFACETWTYNATRIRVSPQDVGYALHVDEVPEPLVISDIEFTALGGTPKSPSSVAAFSYNTPSLTLRRVALTAQNGAAAAEGVAGSPGLLATSTPIAGTPNAEMAPKLLNDASPAYARGQTCTCSTGGTTSGGDGGRTSSLPGKSGAPPQATPTPPGADGAGAPGGQALPSAGSDAPTGQHGAGADRWGDVRAEGLFSTPGADGVNGSPGQGGGGAACYRFINLVVGGGGGCGGCGGGRGTGGAGGGSSIALLASGSPVKVEQSTLTTANAGDGGNGAAGAEGGAGGLGGPAFSSPSEAALARAGGPGGRGGLGGSGGGGAGGISAGVVYQGAKPSVQATIATGKPGAKGIGGLPGTNDGIDGSKAETLLLP